MLQEVRDLQNDAVTALVEQLHYKDEITFKAPTGSGKTHMMADFMDRVLREHKDVVFIVSSLSKGDLAGQNYEQFCRYKASGDFQSLNPYMISSEVSGEESVFIPTDYNVYLLPRDLYKKGGRLMQGAMENFLQTIIMNLFSGGLNKRVFLIKDECHIATTNLDNLSTTYFTKVLNVSATPKLSRGQNPDVEIAEQEAINARLIKNVEWQTEECGVSVALQKFEEIKDGYRNHLGVNPCLIIQISNKDKAADEFAKIKAALAEHQELKWMYIVDKDKDCETNDVFKAKKMPVAKWKDYAKENSSTIDIIIFKMVITEGWDIPRACMLYQIRDTKSKQLDEQVVGRVRRNPRLLDFERLSEEAQHLAMTAWVWGVRDEKKQKVFMTSLFDEPSDITQNIRMRTTKLKPLTRKKDFDLNSFLESKREDQYGDIFSLYKRLKRTDNDIQQMCREYADSTDKWFLFTEHIDEVEKESQNYICNYAESMELVKDECGMLCESSFPEESSYTDNGNYVNISDWVWKRKGTTGSKFSFDSDAEREWATILQNLSKEDTSEAIPQRVGKQTIVGKKNPNAGQYNIDGSIEPEKLNATKKYLWGKNYIANSRIKYEYYLEGVHNSFPDFVMEDCFGRIHLFEVKSVNIANATPASFDSTEYKKKLAELRVCYKQASKLTGHIFYLPVRNPSGVWHITRLMDGEESTLTQDQFEEIVKAKPR